MTISLFETLKIKFEKPDWSKNPAFGLMDTIIEMHPKLLKIVESDITKGCKQSDFGRKDIPSVEQIFRAADIQRDETIGLSGVRVSSK